MVGTEIAQSPAVQYEPGFIVLSYVVSLVGCMTALELLHRRTSTRGAFNWYLLMASSVSMGGIGIWSMHYIGMRAIILANGASDLQLLYSPGFTALSFFLPILVLTVAFYLLAVSGKATKLNILIAGLLTGSAVVSMHYVGYVGIANYKCTYSIGTIVAATIIAIAASLTGLSVFFRLRDTWTDSWWKRGLCAALLAVAVSGMHWTAVVGTSYHYRQTSTPMSGSSRSQTVIFCAVLAFVACVFLLSIALIKKRRSLVHQKRAQELVLACAYFDEDDRVMVSPDGFLPTQKITTQFVRKTFGEDELNRSHPAFMWVYEASRNWSTVQNLVPRMQKQLDANPVARRYLPGHENTVDMARTASSNFEPIFQKLFCVAASKLATQLHQTMEDLGVMFEEPLETGATKSHRTINESLTRLMPHDREKGIPSRFFGKGRYLFLNRRLTRSEVDKFASLGYRFGLISRVADSLARSMQVDHTFMLSRLERMRICTSKDHFQPSGIHLACFMLRPNIHDGFDILVPAVSQNQLPLATLPVTTLSASHLEILNSIDEKSVGEILKELIPNEASNDSQGKDFRWELYSTFVRLVNVVKNPQTMMNAKFSAKPIKAPCRSPEGSTQRSTCILFSVRYLGNVFDRNIDKALSYVPLQFFGAQQLVEVSSARSKSFRLHAQRLFGSDLGATHSQDPNDQGSLTSIDRASGENTPVSPTTKRVSHQIFAKLGISGPRRSHRNSTADLDLDVYSKPTTEKCTNHTTPALQRGPTPEQPDGLGDTVMSIPEGADIPSSEKSVNAKEIASVEEDEIHASFVSELFALFRFLGVQEKGKPQDQV